MSLSQKISLLHILTLLLVLKQKTWQIDAANLPQAKSQQQSSQPAQQPAHYKAQHHQPTISPQSQPQQPHQPPTQYVHEKDSMPEVIKSLHSEEDLGDTSSYHLLSELKHEARLAPTFAAPFPWNPYSSQHQTIPQTPTAPTTTIPQEAHPFGGLASLYTPKFMPFFSYPQPVFIPYPLFITPEMFYSSFPGTTNDFGLEDSMGRAASGHRTASAISAAPSAYPRNSPIYYVRMPTSPYMFLPGIGYSAPPPPPPMSSNPYSNSFSSILPYQSSIPTFSPFSSIFNLPVNFLANGKPSSIYQMGGSPNDIQSPLPFPGLHGFGSRPPIPSNPYRPNSATGSYLPPPSYSIAAPPPPQQDSKMTALKRPFIFNGRPEDIYILPNNFNPLYTDSGYY